MERRSPYLQNTKRQAVAIAFIAVVFYLLFMIGDQAVAKDFTIYRNLSYLAAGADGGIWVVDMTNDQDFEKTILVKTIGSAEGITRDDDTNILYVADGNDGVGVYDLTDPTLPTRLNQVLLQGFASEIVIGKREDLGRKFAYVMLGPDGFAIIDITNFFSPIPIGIVTPGADIPNNTQDVATLGPLIYVADGDALRIWDMTSINQPSLLSELPTPGNAQAIRLENNFIYNERQRGFIADGEGGALFVDLTDWFNPFPLNNFYRDGMNVLDVAQEDRFLYMGDASLGVLVFNFQNGNELPSIINSGSVDALQVGAGVLYTASGTGGFRLDDYSRPQNPSPIRQYETPGEATFSQVFFEIPNLMLQRFLSDYKTPTKVSTSLRLIQIDIILVFGLGFFIWLGFFSQFVLPLHDLKERVFAFYRLNLHIFGTHGPAVYIQDGEIISRTGEDRSRGPGVIMLDTSSAAVLRTNTRYTRAVGPGTVFTRRPEYIANALSLRTQFKGVGPKGNEDPFAPRNEEESDAAYNQRQKNRWETSAKTRDAIEVVPNIMAIFRLESIPQPDLPEDISPEGGTLYGYNRDSVWNAIIHESIDLFDSPSFDEPSSLVDTRRRQTWNWLPVYMIADLWREYLRKYSLEELFAFPTGSDTNPEIPRKTGIETIKSIIRERLTKERYSELDELGRPTGRKVESKEYKILKARGIQLIAAPIKNIRFPPEIEKRIEDQWKATWLYRAEEERRYVQHQRSFAKQIGQDMGLVQFADAAVTQLAQLIEKGEEPDISETLELIVRGNLNQCVRDPELNHYLANEKIDLANLIEWIRRNRPETEPEE